MTQWLSVIVSGYSLAYGVGAIALQNDKLLSWVLLGQALGLSPGIGAHEVPVLWLAVPWTPNNPERSLAIVERPGGDRLSCEYILVLSGKCVSWHVFPPFLVAQMECEISWRGTVIESR